MDRVSSLEAKFEDLMLNLNQQTPKEPNLGEIAYMQAQGEMMANPPYQVEEANYVSNQGYTFRSNNNLPLQYNPRLRNHEKFSYEKKAKFPMSLTSCVPLWNLSDSKIKEL